MIKKISLIFGILLTVILAVTACNKTATSTTTVTTYPVVTTPGGGTGGYTTTNNGVVIVFLDNGADSNSIFYNVRNGGTTPVNIASVILTNVPNGISGTLVVSQNPIQPGQVAKVEVIFQNGNPFGPGSTIHFTIVTSEGLKFEDQIDIVPILITPTASTTTSTTSTPIATSTVTITPTSTNNSTTPPPVTSISTTVTVNTTTLSAKP